MPRSSRYLVDVSPEDRRKLLKLSRKYTAPYREVVRAKIILMAASGVPSNEIAHRLSLPAQTVLKWRKRFLEEGLAGLTERPRRGRGRPRTLPEDVRERIRQLHEGGMSLTGIARLLNEERVSTAHGGKQWYASTVKAVLKV